MIIMTWMLVSCRCFGAAVMQYTNPGFKKSGTTSSMFLSYKQRFNSLVTSFKTSTSTITSASSGRVNQSTNQRTDSGDSAEQIGGVTPITRTQAMSSADDKRPGQRRDDDSGPQTGSRRDDATTISNLKRRKKRKGRLLPGLHLDDSKQGGGEGGSGNSRGVGADIDSATVREAGRDGRTGRMQHWKGNMGKKGLGSIKQGSDDDGDEDDGGQKNQKHVRKDDDIILPMMTTIGRCSHSEKVQDWSYVQCATFLSNRDAVLILKVLSRCFPGMKLV